MSDKTCKRCSNVIPVPTCQCHLCQSVYKMTKWCSKECRGEAGRQRAKIRRRIICYDCRCNPRPYWPKGCAHCEAELAKVTDYVGGHDVQR